MRGNKKEGGKESLKGEVSFFCVSLSGPKGRRSPLLVLLVPLLIRTGLRSKGPGPQSPQEVGCVARVCVLQGIGRGRGGRDTLGQRASCGGSVLYISDNSCVYNLYATALLRAVLFQRWPTLKYLSHL